MAADRCDELLKRILGKYKSLGKHCDRILCVSTDYSAGQLTVEFDFNAGVANDLGRLLLPVLLGDGTAVASLRHSLRKHDCNVLAMSDYAALTYVAMLSSAYE